MTTLAADGRNLAFIVGHYKSGSTWLANLLSLHPEIRGLRETHVFRYSRDAPDLEDCIDKVFNTVAWSEGGRRNLLRNRLARIARPLRRTGQATLRWHERPTTLLDLPLWQQIRMRSHLAQSADAADLCTRFYGFLVAALQPARYLLDKTSTNVFFVPEIHRLFPAAKLIAIYRDGRDVVVSDKHHLRNRYGKTQDFETSVRNWCEAIGAQLAYARAHEMFTLSYESLLSHGPRVTADLLAFLDLPADETLIGDLLQRSSFRFVTGRRLGDERRDDFYRRGGSGGWIDEFSPPQRETFARLAGRLLIELGYEREIEPDGWASSAGFAP